MKTGWGGFYKKNLKKWIANNMKTFTLYFIWFYFKELPIQPKRKKTQLIHCPCWWDSFIWGKDKHAENFEKENFKSLLPDKYVVNKHFRLACMHNSRSIKELEHRVFSINGYGHTESHKSTNSLFSSFPTQLHSLLQKVYNFFFFNVFIYVLYEWIVKLPSIFIVDLTGFVGNCTCKYMSLF